MRMSWSDDRLQWDGPTTGVNVLRVGNDEVWKPDLTLYNSANAGELMSCSNVMPLVWSTGSVLWVPPCHISAYCNLTLEEHPLGEQKCMLKFGSWVYDGLIMDVQLEGKAKADTTYFMSNKWEITKNTATRKDTYYPCCAEPYVNLTYNLVFKRKTSKNTCDKI
ncbi:Acetylcholine receptor subunit alpha-like 1 [Pseudolycoriella hygida]|nr:Acetylcholine receptor subunit alpha-like 1 [Pseudolycoriella hygida]